MSPVTLLRRRGGLTVVELLVAGAVLVAVLAIAATFFARQTQLQRAVQARNELQDRVRTAVQFVVQDLALAGNPVFVAADGSLADPSPFLGCPGTPERCLELADVSETSSLVRMRYVSTQFPVATSCRDVAYRLNAGALERSDVVCAAGAWATPAWVPVAPATLGFKIVLECSDGSDHESYPVSACEAPDGYARSAGVSIAASSLGTAAASLPQDWTVLELGARRDCPANRICFDAVAEVLMPNLKDR